ncbi:MAG: hypothetical protein K2L07_15475, partial [Lachnospiraceae bacterium]|nr:hypothetical protein [Lachnospiraceae bacterium]
LLMILCLLPMSVTACGNNRMASDTDFNMEATQTLTLEETETDTTGTSAALEEDEVTRNLLLLQNGDTKPLVGLSFGDVLDYDGYEIRGWANGEAWYRREDCAYGDVGLVFGGKGNGFSGLKQYWDGNFCGIILGEDTVDTFTEVLGEPDTWEEEASGSETALWAVWNFEHAVLSVRIKGDKVRAVEYLASGDIADAKETPETETDFWIDHKAANGYAEVVYEWSACGWNPDNGYAMYHPYDDDYDVSKVDTFIQNYLREQGIDKETPDGVSYDQNDDLFVEYYVDKEKGQYCFIVHLWAEYWLDYDNGISQYQDAVYCTTYTLHDDDKAGYVLREQDTVQNANRERLYDIWGKKIADVSYEYISQMPFPLITESWNFTAGFSSIPLIRNQKMWFYKEQAQFYEDGRFFSYLSQNDAEYTGEYFPYPCRTVYDTDGRLIAIQAELQEEDLEGNWGWWDDSIDYSGQITFDYYEDGTVKSADYVRSSYTYGTTDSSGNIVYDQKGRMIYNEYYITHGSDASIYLYEEDSDMPWCVLCWCSYAPGFESVYLFLPVD